MTRGQWDVAVGWTHNLHGNSLLGHQMELSQIRRFQKRLEERIEAGVDLSTILWIWDEYAKLTESGKRYQHFREQMLSDIQRVGPKRAPSE